MCSMRSIAAGEHAASQSPPSDGEALLRGEVVDVDLGRVPAEAAGGRGGVDDDEAVARQRDACKVIATPVDVSLWVRA